MLTNIYIAKIKLLLAVMCLSLLSISCASNAPQSLYLEMGGQEKIEEVAAFFIEEISLNKDVMPYFEHTNVDRFYEKLVEHLCEVSNGPCEYTGDSMQSVHTGMNISKNHFNQTVDLLINAMNKAGIAHSTQNKLLARLAPMRKDIIKR